jgi:D-serine deaminase-like pyridoxal phosphate-dependent protein
MSVLSPEYREGVKRHNELGRLAKEQRQLGLLAQAAIESGNNWQYVIEREMVDHRNGFGTDYVAEAELNEAGK